MLKQHQDFEIHILHHQKDKGNKKNKKFLLKPEDLNHIDMIIEEYININVIKVPVQSQNFEQDIEELGYFQKMAFEHFKKEKGSFSMCNFSKLMQQMTTTNEENLSDQG